MGQGDRKRADQVATETMRSVMDSVPMDGTIVIGEGERDEAPMLYIGEKVGKARWRRLPRSRYRGRSPRRHQPVRQRIARRHHRAGCLRARRPAARPRLLHGEDGGRPILQRHGRSRSTGRPQPCSHRQGAWDARVEDLVIVILDRPRHERLIADVRKAGARILLISDGDLSPGVAAAMLGSGVHAVMGAGGAPEGVITAAAIRCLNGYMVGRLTGYTPEQAERMPDMGIKDPKRIYTAEELAPGKNIVFAATGVTDGPLLKGVRFFGDGVRTTSLVMKMQNRKVRFIESIHVSKNPDAKVRIP